MELWQKALIDSARERAAVLRLHADCRKDTFTPENDPGQFERRAREAEDRVAALEKRFA